MRRIIDLVICQLSSLIILVWSKDVSERLRRIETKGWGSRVRSFTLSVTFYRQLKYKYASNIVSKFNVQIASLMSK